MDLLALAFADNTFQEKWVQRPEDLYRLEIPHLKLLSIQWKPKIRETPVFRRFKGIAASDDDPFTFTDSSHYIK